MKTKKPGRSKRPLNTNFMRCCVCGKFLKFLNGDNFGISVLIGTQIKKAHIKCAQKNNLEWFDMSS